MHIADNPSSHRLEPKYWEKFYNTGEMPWDLGEPTPIFKNWIHSQKKSLSICILGAGNGWDALYFAEKGHKVTAIDFALSAVNNMKKAAKKKNLNLNIICADIFNLDKLYDEKFDIVLEYTCYCAIDPNKRIHYIHIVNHLLKPSGQFVGILFPIDKELDLDGPPFGVEFNSTIAMFSKYFTLVKKEESKLSIERRQGKEVFVILKKNE